MDEPTPNEAPQADPPVRDRGWPFSSIAARFSWYAGWVVFLGGSATSISPWIAGLFYLLYLADLILAIVGIIGGIRRRDQATLGFGLGGLLLTVLPFAAGFVLGLLRDVLVRGKGH